MQITKGMRQRWWARVRMVRVFAGRELTEQYAGSFLGTAWSLLQPILLILVYWWVFGVVWDLRVPGGRDLEVTVPFVIFLLSALLPWLLLFEIVNKGAAAVTDRAEVIRHGAFPPLVFPVARAMAAHVIFLPLIALFCAYLLWTHEPMHFGALPVLAVVLVIQAVFAVGLGILFAALTVFVRDVQHGLPMALMALFFTAPVLYPLVQVPDSFLTVMWFNPFTPFAESYHVILLEGRAPEPRLWGLMTAYATAALAIGYAVFVRLRPGFADAF